MSTVTSFMVKSLLLLFIQTLWINSSFAQAYKELESPRKQIIYFDLPSQPLKNGLIEFAIQSKITIIVEDNLVDGFRSRPIVGPHDPEKALTLLLSKAPLTFTVQAESQSILIQPEKPNPLETDEAFFSTTLNSEPNQKFEEVVIQGKQYPFRYNTISNSQVYGSTSSFSSARFINVIPQRLITDQLPDDLGDALKLSSGITPSDGLADSNDDFYVRGFPRYGVYLDGFRLSSDTGTKLSMVNVEQVEVLKGPSTLFYGQAEPGGIINVVRKKPQQELHNKFGITAASNNEKLLFADLTGPIAQSQQTLLYRFIASQKNQDAFRDLTDVESQLFAPSFTWSPAESTIINLTYQKQNSEQTRDQGTVILAPLRESVDVVSVDRDASQARSNFSAQNSITTLELQHYFSPNWSVLSSFHQSNESRYGIRGGRDTLFTSNILLDKADLEPEIIVRDGLLLQGTYITKERQWLPVAVIRSLYDEISKEHSKAFKTIVNGNYDAGSSTNELTLGLNWSSRNHYEEYILEQRNDIQSLSLADRERNGVQEAVEAVFIDNPSLGELTSKYQSLNYNDYGLFLLNSTQLNQEWRASVGARYTVTQGSQQGSNNVSASKLRTYNQLSSELGLNYQPTEAAAFYFNYSEGFKANYQVDDVDTQLNKPELSTQLELGVKTFLFSDALMATVAVFDINKTNVVDIKFIEGLRTASVQGKQNTQGVDMDFTYQVNSNFDILGSLSLTDPKIDAGEFKGNTPELAAKKVGSVFMNYNVNEGRAKGLGFNIGAFYIGERFGNNDNNDLSKIESFYTVDIGASYQFGTSKHPYRFQLGIKNLLDQDYILATEGRIRSNHGAGRRGLASLSLDF